MDEEFQPRTFESAAGLRSFCVVASKANFMTIFVNGRQKRVPRPRLIEGMSVDEFTSRNGDFVWLHQDELWELMPIDSLDSATDERLNIAAPQSDLIAIGRTTTGENHEFQRGNAVE